MHSKKSGKDGKEYFDTTKNGRKIKRWRLDNPNEEATIYKAGWLGHLVHNGL